MFPIHRPRRMRANASIRALAETTTLTPSDLILPVFVQSQAGKTPIESLPGVDRLDLPSLAKEAQALWRLGIKAMALFPVVDPALKSKDARAAYDPDGLIPKAIQAVKSAEPEMLVITDVALDPYTLDGQDGLTDETGYVINDATNEILVRQALCQAKAGADIVAPSDMMDGRIGAIRKALEQENLVNTLILAYTAKYASCFYGPFRDAVGSKASLGKSNKASYQLSARASTKEALLEAKHDTEEGADMLMVKPALPYLDRLWEISQTSLIPVLAYQVSGEYAMLRYAAKAGALDLRAATLESLISIKRSGASAILTYSAKEAATWLLENPF